MRTSAFEFGRENLSMCVNERGDQGMKRESVVPFAIITTQRTRRREWGITEPC